MMREEEWIEAARQGDQDAFAELVRLYEKRVYAVASLIGGGLYYVMHVLDINQLLSVGCGMLVIFALRLFATIYKWNLPSVKLD